LRRAEVRCGQTGGEGSSIQAFNLCPQPVACEQPSCPRAVGDRPLSLWRSRRMTAPDHARDQRTFPRRRSFVPTGVLWQRPFARRTRGRIAAELAGTSRRNRTSSQASVEGCVTTELPRRPFPAPTPSIEIWMPDPDDLTPEQRGAAPSPARRHERDQQLSRPAGRLGRPRSWLTAVVALLALVACYWFIIRTP
jgi:hypothetical protein